MNPWHVIDFPTQGALRFDPIEHITADPQRPGEVNIYMEGAAGLWTFDRDTLFEPSWIASVESSLGLDVVGAQIFHRWPNYQHPTAHIDLCPHSHAVDSSASEHAGVNNMRAAASSNSWNLDDYFSPIAGFNWVISEPDDSEMVWYDLPPKEGWCLQKNDTNSMYVDWPTHELNEVGRHTIGSRMTAVRVNIPHTVYMGGLHRWVITMRVNNSWQSWEHLVSSFT